jgi:5'-3' exonuclease
MRVHLLDGTYELFRQHFGRPARKGDDGSEIGATYGVITSVMSMLEGGVTHLGVATDHVIKSFRNELWSDYKTGDQVPEVLLSQFEQLEDALAALGVVVWPMVDVEADDALASAASVAADDPGVDQVVICTPDKDLAQCVVGNRVVQLDRRHDVTTDEDGVRAKFGVSPSSIPDWLALVGDAADGFPGLSGWGKRSAAVVLAHYGHLESIPDDVKDWEPFVRKGVRGADRLAATLAAERPLVDLFRTLATLRIDREIFIDVADLEWHGPKPAFEETCGHFRSPALLDRVEAIVASRGR